VCSVPTESGHFNALFMRVKPLTTYPGPWKGATPCVHWRRWGAFWAFVLKWTW
jgi:hypothetical protein